MENKLQKKENNPLISKSKFESKLNILVEGQTNNLKQLQAIRNDLQKGFIGLALRNEELLKFNDQLKQQLEIVVDELNAIKQEREEKAALCLLAVTGVRINELLNIKVSQLETLTQESWIAIDRSKRGPSNHKAFLTQEGKKIIQDRKKDFQFILLIKEPDAYVFTSEANHYQKLRPEAITKGVNKVMRSVSKQLPGQPNVTSHSFRIG